MWPSNYGLLFFCCFSLILSCGPPTEELSHSILHRAGEPYTLDAVALFPGTEEPVAVGGNSFLSGYIYYQAGDSIGPKRFFAARAMGNTVVATGLDGYWYEVTETGIRLIDKGPIFKAIRDFEISSEISIAVTGKSLGQGSILRVSDDYSTSVDTNLMHEVLAVTTACGGIVTGYGGIFRHTGEQWQYVDSPADFYTDISVEGETCVAVGIGGSIIRSTDCGRTWSVALKISSSLTQLPQIEAIDHRSGLWVCVGDDLILASTDQGLNWQRYQLSENYHMSDVAIADDRRLYITTFEGVLLEVSGL